MQHAIHMPVPPRAIVPGLPAGMKGASIVERAAVPETTGGPDLLLMRVSAQRRRVRRGEYLYRGGADFQALYVVRAGAFKTVLLTEDGREQVTGFHMAGEVLGLDAIGSDVYAGDAVALEDSDVAEIPFAALEERAAREPALQRELWRMLASEIQRERTLMVLLGSMRAEERLAAFLLNLSQRMAARGFSANRFVLRMTREEIGSLLGLKLETVSRLLSRFQTEGLIMVRHREIEIKAIQALRAVIGRVELRRERLPH